MGEKVKKTIAEELQHAKLTFIFRFVSKEGKVVERLIDFESIHSHK